MATKKIVEKKTGEKYASKAAMKKHEKSESKAEMKKEYGKPKPPTKQVAREQSHSSKMENKNSDKVNSVVKKNIPIKQVSKKIAYDLKEVSNPKLTTSARKNYADNAESAMKQLAKHKMPVKKAPSKMKKC